jgi:hypothetical protein
VGKKSGHIIELKGVVGQDPAAERKQLLEWKVTESHQD